MALEQIVFSYPDAAPALRGVSAAIHRGERIAVLGNNGAGKSTFFLICNGILRPQQGTVYADGQPVSYTRRGLTALRRKVGIVFQDADNQIIALGRGERDLLWPDEPAPAPGGGAAGR